MAPSSGKSLSLGNLGVHVKNAEAEPRKPPPLHKDKNKLRRIRTGGIIAGLSGLGLMGYAVAAATAGPVGWAAWFRDPVAFGEASDRNAICEAAVIDWRVGPEERGSAPPRR